MKAFLPSFVIRFRLKVPGSECLGTFIQLEFIFGIFCDPYNAMDERKIPLAVSTPKHNFCGSYLIMAVI